MTKLESYIQWLCYWFDEEPFKERDYLKMHESLRNRTKEVIRYTCKTIGYPISNEMVDYIYYKFATGRQL